MEIPENKWREVRALGSGGFGCVSLCQKGTSDNYIAIKRCNHKSQAAEVSPRLMERWRTEVYTMGRLNHDNVVQAFELPPELKPGPGEPPILAMEYCEGGDLRKVLNLPQNCCGLRERDIRQLVSGIGSAIEYLHCHRIIHRDLKPENIVLKYIGNRILYKIIDLGYVKELDNSSICTSFVGTQQYLAPELNIRQPYTKTVDYWSFGTLIFECVTGQRPFLPDATLIQWHESVRKKSPDDITAFFEDQKVKFSKKLPKPNQLCRIIEGYFEEWLKLMLRWDSKARGGGVIQIRGKDRPRCFFQMEQVLSLKIFHILYVEANTVLSYRVREENTIRDVQVAIETETKIPISQQIIMLARGSYLEPAQPAFVGCADNNSEDVSVFLFSQAPVKPEFRKTRKPPPPVQTIIKERDIYLAQKDQKKVWARAVLWCCEQNRDYKQLVLSQRTALLCLLRNSSKISNIKKQKSEMLKEKEKLFACVDHFRHSLEVDLRLHTERLKNMATNDQIEGRNMQERWVEMDKRVETMISVHDEVQRLDIKVDDLNTDVIELQKSPFGKQKQPNSLEQLEGKAKSLYDSLITALKAGEAKDQEEMREHVITCFKEQETLFTTLYKHISKVMQCLTELQLVLPELNEMTERIMAYRKQLYICQQERQKDIWSLMDSSLNGLTVNNPQMSPTTAFTETSFLQTGGGASLLMSVANSNMESLRLVDDCKANNQKIQDTMKSLFQDHEESMSYLSNANV